MKKMKAVIVTGIALVTVIAVVFSFMVRKDILYHLKSSEWWDHLKYSEISFRLTLNNEAYKWCNSAEITELHPPGSGYRFTCREQGINEEGSERGNTKKIINSLYLFTRQDYGQVHKIWIDYEDLPITGNTTIATTFFGNLKKGTYTLDTDGKIVLEIGEEKSSGQL